MRYPHRLTITDPATPQGTQDAATGAWTPDAGATAAVLYDGAADVQDVGAVIERDADGKPTLRSDATAFLADERALAAIPSGAPATVTWDDGTTAEATVVRVRRLDGSLALQWVGGSK